MSASLVRRTWRLSVDTIPEEITPLDVEFWPMWHLANEIRWAYGPVVAKTESFDDSMRAIWYRVNLEPKPMLGGILHTKRVGHPEAMIKKKVEVGPRCFWPRYKTIDVPIEKRHYNRDGGERVLKSCMAREAVRVMRRGGLT